MKIYTPGNFSQNRQFTLNQKKDSNTLFTTRTTTQTLSTSSIEFSFKASETSRLNTITQGKLTMFDSLSFKEQEDITQDKALELISDDGYYGVAKTSKRIADFVLKGAGDDLELLKQGRKGVLQGFEAAEKAWGGKLPPINYETIENAVKSIDDRINELGGNIMEITT